MKKITFLLAGVLFTLLTLAQVPQSFKYQAVLRDGSGHVQGDQTVSIEIDIIQGSIIGSAIYIETHNATTNAFGVVNLEIGKGITAGNFTEIDWSNGPYFITIRVDGIVFGTSQLLSVPYALYSLSAQQADYSDSSAYSASSEVGRSLIHLLSAELGVTSGQFTAYGISVQELYESGLNVNTLYSGGITVNQLLDLGIGINEIVEADLPVDSILLAGFTVADLVGANEDVDEMLAAGITLSELLAENESISDLLGAGITVAQLVAENVPVSDMLGAGVTAAQLVAANESISEMLAAGISVADLVSAGEDVGDMIIAGANLNELFDAGILAGILAQEGADADSLTAAGLIGLSAPDFDGNTYTWVKIGNQIWMSQDMKAKHYSDGTPLLDGTGVGSISSDYDSKYYFSYNDDSLNAETYGYLYTWPAATNDSASNTNPSDIQGICPSGWHIPSDDEWKELEMELGMSQAQANALDNRGTNQGDKLKEVGLTHWRFSTYSIGTNESGFISLPGGYRNYDSFSNLGFNARYWTSSAISPHKINAYIRMTSYNSGTIYRRDVLTNYGHSVRCVKD